MAGYSSTINPRGRGGDRTGRAHTDQALASEILGRSKGSDQSRVQKSAVQTDSLWKPVQQGSVYDPEKGRARAAQQQALMAQGAQIKQLQGAIAQGQQRAQQQGAQWANAANRNSLAPQGGGGQYEGDGISVAARAAYDAGFRGDDLVQIVGIAGRESGFQPTAHRSDRDKSAGSGDRGLWQINYIWDDSLRGAGIINSWSDLFDPATNAQAARYVFQQQGWPAWGVAGGSWGAGPHVTGTDLNQARNTISALGLL